MSRAVAKDTEVVSLDEYRRARGGHSVAPAPRMRPALATPPMSPVWVYWVPVWIW
jgi:hypothetical protein